MHLGRLGRGELLAVVGGLLLALGVFAPWYGTNADNPNAMIDGARGTFSAWEVHPIVRWLLLAAAVAPLILAWIVVRDHELSWPRGELTAVVGLAALTLILVKGFIFKPGEPSGQISLTWGYLIALIGAILILAGAFVRTTEIGAARKPPGVM
jgi:hypothetical protein